MCLETTLEKLIEWREYKKQIRECAEYRGLHRYDTQEMLPVLKCLGFSLRWDDRKKRPEVIFSGLFRSEYQYTVGENFPNSCVSNASFSFDGSVIFESGVLHFMVQDESSDLKEFFDSLGRQMSGGNKYEHEKINRFRFIDGGAIVVNMVTPLRNVFILDYNECFVGSKACNVLDGVSNILIFPEEEYCLAEKAVLEYFTQFSHSDDICKFIDVSSIKYEYRGECAEKIYTWLYHFGRGIPENEIVV